MKRACCKIGILQQAAFRCSEAFRPVRTLGGEGRTKGTRSVTTSTCQLSQRERQGGCCFREVNGRPAPPKGRVKDVCDWVHK